MTAHIEELFEVIKNKNLDFVYNTNPIIQKFHESTSNLRDYLLEYERLKFSQGKLPQLSQNSPTKLSPKYQLDFLGQDIPTVINQFCISLAGAHYYSSSTSDTTQHYFFKHTDLFFWNNIDTAFRMASSGWDRVSHLLKLAFNLNIDKYNIANVLKAIPKKEMKISQDANYKFLKNFRDSDFGELESGLGAGARNETTHVLTRNTRFFLEYLEQFNPNGNKFNIRRDEELKLVEKHYWLLRQGLDKAFNLIGEHFDKKFYLYSK